MWEREEKKKQRVGLWRSSESKTHCRVLFLTWTPKLTSASNLQNLWKSAFLNSTFTIRNSEDVPDNEYKDDIFRKPWWHVKQHRTHGRKKRTFLWRWLITFCSAQEKWSSFDKENWSVYVVGVKTLSCATAIRGRTDELKPDNHLQQEAQDGNLRKMNQHFLFYMCK